MLRAPQRRAGRRAALVLGVVGGTLLGMTPAAPPARGQTTPSPAAAPSPTIVAATATVAPMATLTVSPTVAVSPSVSVPSAGSSPRPAPIDANLVNDPRVQDPVRRGAPRHAILRAQILLDHAHFSVGEIDAGYGANSRRAIAALQRARDLPETGEVDGVTWAALNGDTSPALVSYVVTAEDVAGPFVPVPRKMMDKAHLEALSYSSLLEELGEKFHVAPALLAELNAGRSIANAGDEITVPNIVYGSLPGVREIVVDESDRSLTVIDATGAVFARYPATTGSSHDPLPIGRWRVNGVAHYPPFHYNPKLFWDADATDRKTTIAPGPNNPVGVVWIDLSKEHYGIHGTPEPATIGRSQSHGCIRLTNWSAAELAQIVRYGTPAILQE